MIILIELQRFIFYSPRLLNQAVPWSYHSHSHVETVGADLNLIIRPLRIQLHYLEGVLACPVRRTKHWWDLTHFRNSKHSSQLTVHRHNLIFVNKSDVEVALVVIRQ